MTIEFVVEDGTGKSDATSYVSVADASQILENYGKSWPSTLSTDALKQAALNVGTRFVDSKYHAQWQGFRTTEAQALDFPRVDVVDVDDYPIDSDEIPEKLKQAVVEAAVYWGDNDKAFPSLDDEGRLKRSKIKLDVLEIDEEYIGASAPSEINSTVDMLLSDLLNDQDGVGGSIPVTRG